MIIRNTDATQLPEQERNPFNIRADFFANQNGNVTKRNSLFANIKLGTINGEEPLVEDGEREGEEWVFPVSSDTTIGLELEILLHQLEKDCYIYGNEYDSEKFWVFRSFSTFSIEKSTIKKIDDNTIYNEIINATEEASQTVYIRIPLSIFKDGAFNQVVEGNLTLNFHYQSDVAEGAYGPDINSLNLVRKQAVPIISSTV